MLDSLYNYWANLPGYHVLGFGLIAYFTYYLILVVKVSELVYICMYIWSWVIQKSIYRIKRKIHFSSWVQWALILSANFEYVSVQ